ncbi:MAG: YjbQ family protein [Chloroflexota bacterium]|jgi:secondary thiamine-phosphate synthase enzyme
MERFTVRTSRPTEMVDITGRVQEIVSRMGARDGVVHLYCPHTTAGLTVNENWDPDVQRDILLTLDGHIAPPDPRHRHGEGNSPAHIKASLFGSSVLVFVEQSRLQLGQWQGVYLAEFDGPRQRQVWVKFLGERGSQP